MDKKTIIFAASLVAALAFSWFFIWPQMENIEELRSVIQEEREVLNDLKNAEDRVKSAIRLKEDIEIRDRDLIDMAVPSDPERVEATILLNRIAEESGFNVSAVAVSEPSSSAGMINPMGVGLELSGSYSAIKTLAGMLEGTLRIFNITNIEIQAPTLSEGEQESIDSHDDVKFRVEVRGNIFHSSR